MTLFLPKTTFDFNNIKMLFPKELVTYLRAVLHHRLDTETSRTPSDSEPSLHRSSEDDYGSTEVLRSDQQQHDTSISHGVYDLDISEVIPLEDSRESTPESVPDEISGFEPVEEIGVQLESTRQRESQFETEERDERREGTGLRYEIRRLFPQSFLLLRENRETRSGTVYGPPMLEE
ncbi:uncharacterized protein [Parasteatoda tepidariorum]|nr:uncharacterized protein LOC107443646 [Parasteatoda tepidariorum]